MKLSIEFKLENGSIIYFTIDECQLNDIDVKYMWKSMVDSKKKWMEKHDEEYQKAYCQYKKEYYFLEELKRKFDNMTLRNMFNVDQMIYVPYNPLCGCYK